MNRRVPIILTAILVVATIAPAASAAATSTTDTQELECSFPIEKTDASGYDVTVKEEPERIVTLNPSAAQTMWEIGGREKVVGVSQFAGFLDGADSREVVTSGFPSSVNVEKVIKLNPDLVLAPNTIKTETVTQLRDAGVTVYRFSMAASIEDIYQKTDTIGQLTGECSGADSTVTNMRDNVQTVEAAVEGEERPSVFYDMGNRYTAGPNTFIGGIISKAGGHNIVADASTSQAYPQLSAEFIVEQDPDFLVVNAQPEALDDDPKSHIPEDSVLRETTAFKQGNIVVVDTNHISQPAPRVVEPMVQMTQAFHPEAYAGANLGKIAEGSSSTDSGIERTTYSHTIVDNDTIRLDTTLNYLDEETANFSVPATFRNESNPRLTNVQVTPHEPNWRFGVTATELETNTTLPDSATPLVGYQFTPHGMWPDSLETLSVTAALNTSQPPQNISAEDITAYTNQSGNWTATPVSTTTTNETIWMQVNASTYTSVYFAANTTEITSQPTIERTSTTTTEPTANATTTTASTAQSTEPPATDTASTATESATSAAPQTTPNTTGTTIPGFGALATILSFILVSVGVYGRYRFNE